MSDWRPIKTVGDVKRILGLNSKKIIYIYNWNDDKYARRPHPFWRIENAYVSAFDSRHPLMQPILWQPLPELPEDF